MSSINTCGLWLSQGGATKDDEQLEALDDAIKKQSECNRAIEAEVDGGEGGWMTPKSCEGSGSFDPWQNSSGLMESV